MATNEFIKETTGLELNLMGLVLGVEGKKIVYNLLFLPKDLTKKDATPKDYLSIIISDEEASNLLASLSALKIKSYPILKELKKKKK